MHFFCYYEFFATIMTKNYDELNVKIKLSNKCEVATKKNKKQN